MKWDHTVQGVQLLSVLREVMNMYSVP
jgi:hypothetical protein